ncbi:hypothetical protein R3W88_022862 [Solanum pinnatisectum]|uniref:Endonuclease/exonuclease/phosphatase domain-containing protein n=1 Tax=Solanum pinnatisectum TaxID=50273 RepID=A0AAV9LZ65_9SOLN|nr:hypothetical protein R3W88_022862 [Solanum pinnatisectum]
MVSWLHCLWIEVEPQEHADNLRGVNKRYKQKELKNYLQANKISIAGLIETRVKEQNMKARIRGIAPGWGILNNYNATSNGRIWVIWDENRYEIKVISSTAQVLHCLIKDRIKGQQKVLIVVYAGDFNAILSPQDRRAGASISLNDVKDFAACIQSMGVIELQWQGDYYSWTNKQHGDDKISSKIDRVFGNYEWMEQWGHVITEYENLKEYRTGQMQRVWCKLKAFQPVLRQLNNKEFKFISQKMENAREELNRIQEHITSQATDEQIDQVEKWSMIEEIALRQKSRIK